MYVDPVGFDDLPEGIARPGFFRGVATIVTKLLNVVQPDLAYFGQKDALQCISIKKLVEVCVRRVLLLLPGRLICAPGCALSMEETTTTEVLFFAERFLRSFVGTRGLLARETSGCATVRASIYWRAFYPPSVPSTSPSKEVVVNERQEEIEYDPVLCLL